MESYHSHQLILPTDKRNPCFSLYATGDGQGISVFYGLELFEVVPNDHEHMAFKMMLGRLRNARVRITTLARVFEVDRKTIGLWGDAILSRDPERLQRVLSGHGANQKRTPAIDQYVRRRPRELLSEACPDYRATLIREVESIFQVKLCGETIRQVCNDIGEIPAAEPAADPACRTMSDPSSDATCRHLEERTCAAGDIMTTDDLAGDSTRPSIQATSIDTPPLDGTPHPSKSSPPNWNPQPGDTILCDHVGALIFASALSTISALAL